MSDQEFREKVLQHLGEIKEKQLYHGELLTKMDKAVFTGNGQPGLLSRVTELETKMESAGEVKKDRRSTWSVVVATLALIASVVMGWIRHS